MTNSQPETASTTPPRPNRFLALGLLAIALAMVGMAFAAVPLYRIFCQQTGYGGTTQRAEAPSSTVADRTITVRFDANMSSDLDWSFWPVQRQMKLKIGENKLAFYKAVNRTGKPLTGSATFNVTPEIVGSYFSKIECFCFTEQTLAAGQEADLPVSFFIDPAILEDPDASRIDEITLSYTFFKVEQTDRSAQTQSGKGASTRSFENGGRSG